MTGADSPVIAASFTEAIPSTTLAVRWNGIACLDHDHVADPEIGARNPPEIAPSVPIRSFAWVSVRVRRNASACALPRPSAIASRNWRTAP
jgi:hypothetical protein